jgi:predicted ester cyclase
VTPTDAVRAYVDAFNAGEWERLKNLFDPAANIRGVLGWGGLDVAMPIWRELHDSMNMHLEIERLVEDGDTVVALLNETGRFSAPFRGLPGKAPTGKTYEIIAIEWFEFSGDRIMRRWAARDSAAITRQVCE